MSSIEWTDMTWNPVSGCTRASAGCDHCYAVGMTHRLASMGQAAKYGGLTVLNGKNERHFNGVVRTHEDALSIPLRRKKPTRWFVNSMSDLFHKEVPFAFIDRVFAVMALCPQHTFQVLTKRPARMAVYLSDERVDRGPHSGQPLTNRERVNEVANGMSEPPDNDYAFGMGWPLPNVWLGTSVEDQAAAYVRIPDLLKCPAAVRFLSCEPLLGELDLTHFLPSSWCCNRCGQHWIGDGPSCNECGDYGVEVTRGLDWVIVGGESGKGARPCDIAWIRSLVEQGKAAGVPVFVKQLGSHCIHEDDDFTENVWPDGPEMTFPADEPYFCRVRLDDRKGGDPDGWPADLRVREFPLAAEVADG